LKGGIVKKKRIEEGLYKSKKLKSDF